MCFPIFETNKQHVHVSKQEDQSRTCLCHIYRSRSR